MNNGLNKLLISKILFSKNSKSKLIRSFFLIVLIVSLLIVSSIFINSMSKGIASKFSLLVNGDVEVYTNDDLLKKYDFIESTTTVATVTSLIYGKEDTQISILKAVEDSFFDEKRLSSLHLEKIDVDTTLPTIIVSKQIANMLNLKLGERAALMLAQNESNLRPKLVVVEGIYDSGYKEIDLNLCFMKLDDLIGIYKEDVNLYQEVIIKDNISLNEAVEIFNGDDYFSRPWYEIQESVYNNILVSTQSLLIVFIVIALLTGYFVSSISSDLITKDHKTIATNKLLGLTDKTIKRNYFIAVELFTILSTIIGIFLGILISKTFLNLLGGLSLDNIPSLSWYLFDFDIIIPIKNIAIIGLSIIIVSLGSVYLSLRRIKKIEILELLSRE